MVMQQQELEAKVNKKQEVAVKNKLDYFVNKFHNQSGVIIQNDGEISEEVVSIGKGRTPKRLQSGKSRRESSINPSKSAQFHNIQRK